MTRPRINPFPKGSAEHLLFDRWRRSNARATELQAQANQLQTDADAEKAKADHYVRALEALGHRIGQRLLEGPAA